MASSGSLSALPSPLQASEGEVGSGKDADGRGFASGIPSSAAAAGLCGSSALDCGLGTCGLPSFAASACSSAEPAGLSGSSALDCGVGTCRLGSSASDAGLSTALDFGVGT